MNYPLLRRYLLKAAGAEGIDPSLQGDMIRLLQQVTPDGSVQHQEHDEVMDADVAGGLPSQNKQKGVEDQMLQQALPEMQLPNPHTPEVFGKLNPPPIIKTSVWEAMTKAAVWKQVKQASSFIKDVKVKDLPPSVREDVARFIPPGKEDRSVVQYGMVASEIEKLVDPHNYKAAQKFVKDLKLNYKDVYDKLHDKYILLVNHRVVDGHNFLAKVKKVGLSNSINVLDLTPARLQK